MGVESRLLSVAKEFNVGASPVKPLRMTKNAITLFVVCPLADALGEDAETDAKANSDGGARKRARHIIRKSPFSQENGLCGKSFEKRLRVFLFFGSFFSRRFFSGNFD